ncbi:MAG: serine aminopeptidase domain-containing protein [Armatimonadota bacterium]
MNALPEVATRIDHDGGFSEEATFVDVDGAKMFSMTHLPGGPALAGVVICPSILVEHLTNYRHEVLLARALAARGVAVQRFHYRGTGHSSGEERETSLDSMVKDTCIALERLRERAGIKRVAFVGTRWGALVGAMVAQGVPQGPLALWEPVTDGARYFRELIRGRRVRELKDARFASAATDSWASELEAQGFIDILGYSLHRSVYESGRGQRLDALLAERTGPVLIVQFGRQSALRPDYARLRDALAARGAECAVQFISDEPAWFFPGHLMKSAGALVKLTTDWLVAAARKAEEAS